MITATKILAALVPEEIFSGPDAVEREYKTLAKRFHPDLKNPESDSKVFANLSVLHEQAKQKIKTGEWKILGQLDLESDDGKKFRIHYVKDFINGIATGYIGKKIITYVLDKEYADLAEIAIKNLNSLKFDGKEKMRIYIPKIIKSFKTNDGKTVIVYEKPENVIRLRDVVDHFNGKIDPRHAAWIMSRLSNFACWLEHIGMSHNDLSMDTVFICPKHHAVMVIGGWWHAASIGKRMQRQQTGRTISALPRKVMDTKIADVKTDLSLIRLLGREILGDSTGMSFIKDKSIPNAFASWVREAPIGEPVKDFKRWETVVVSSFGERRFTKLELTHENVYGEK